VLLVNAYGSRRRLVSQGAAVAVLLAVLAGGAAGSSIAAYGVAADGASAIAARPSTLRSIPTEADTTQKSTPLAAGSLVVIDRTFLDGRWLRVVFENGQTGWVRREDVVPIWR